MLKKIVDKITTKTEPLRLAFFSEREDLNDIQVSDFGDEVWLTQYNKEDDTNSCIMLTKEQMLTLHFFFRRKFEIPPSTREIKE